MGSMRVLLRNFIKIETRIRGVAGGFSCDRATRIYCFFVMSAGGRATRRDLHRWFKICNAIAQTLQIKSVTFDLQDLLQSIIFVADI